MQRTLSFFIGLILLFTSVPAFAVTDVFTNPEDSYVRESSPDTNYGSEPVLIADGVSQDPDNGIYGEVITLIQWDISSIPADATVTAAFITFNYTNESSGDYEFYLQNQPWSENSVTWEDLNPGAILMGTIPAYTLGEESRAFDRAGIPLIQGWVDGSIPNNGIIIRTFRSNNGIGMESKEASGFIPTLHVVYDTITETLEQRVAYLEQLLAGVTRNNNNIHFSGVNVHIDNGLGATNGNPEEPDSINPDDTSVNGLGNLIVGYNEPFPSSEFNDKSGSHNVIIGHGHSYSSFGGTTVGQDNRILAPYTSVTGGIRNRAGGEYSSVSGGSGNWALAKGSSISGGSDNLIQNTGEYASISGGSYHEATGENSSISGGVLNTAHGENSSITGGRSGITRGYNSTVSGGFANTANGDYSTVSGGHARSVDGESDWAAGSLFEDH